MQETQDQNGNRDDEEEVSRRKGVDDFEVLPQENCFLRVESDILETESQVLNIETTVTETFKIYSDEIHRDFEREVIELDRRSLGSSMSGSEEGRRETELTPGGPPSLDVYSDTFERAFEGVQEMVTSPGSPSCSSVSSLRSRGRLEEEEDRRQETASLEEVQKKSCLDKTARPREKEVAREAEGERAQAHRTVTFNDKNEVASQDRDGTFKVTYRQLGEKIRRGEGEERVREEGKKSALRCVVGERSRLESAVASPRTLDFDTCSHEELIQYALPSERREMRREEEEWDNPFQPEGEVSHDADLILQLWKGGKLGEDTLAANLAKAASAESSLASSPQHTGSPRDTPTLLNGKENGTVVGDDTGSQMENGFATVNGGHDIAKNGKVSLANGSPVKGIKHEQGPGFPLSLSDKQKHKNKLKKHCNMM